MQVTVKLKQHSPIIHFQHGEAGATLRASELKPGIDKFIVHDLQTVDPLLYEKYRDVITGNFEQDGKGCNRYGLSVSVLQSANVKPENPPPPYFAENKKSLFTSAPIDLKIKSFDKSLRELVKDVLPYVLTYKNFGTRASKGFGAYHLSNMTAEKFESLALKKYPKVYKLSKKFSDYKEAFKEIQIFYQGLKAGVNHKTYQKSLLFEYMCSKNIRWEKRKIKQEFPEVISPGSRPPADCGVEDDEFRYVRAMLGLAEHNEYRLPGNAKKQVKIDSSEAERLASPITFKIFNNAVYLLPNETYRLIMDKTFTFSLDGRSFELQTPGPDEFDLCGFLDFVVSKNVGLSLI
jgi:hypothetical protein